MRVTAQDIITAYYTVPAPERLQCEWHVRRKTFEQIDQDVYPVRLSNQLMGRPVKIDHKMTEGKIKLVPEENK